MHNLVFSSKRLTKLFINNFDHMNFLYILNLLGQSITCLEGYLMIKCSMPTNFIQDHKTDNTKPTITRNGVFKSFGKCNTEDRKRVEIKGPIVGTDYLVLFHRGNTLIDEEELS